MLGFGPVRNCRDARPQILALARRRIGAERRGGGGAEAQVAVRDLQAGRAGHDYRRERRAADAAGDAATFLPPPPAAAEREVGAGGGVRCAQLDRVFEALCSGVPGGGGGVALRLVMGRTLQAQPPAALIFYFHCSSLFQV